MQASFAFRVSSLGEHAHAHITHSAETVSSSGPDPNAARIGRHRFVLVTVIVASARSTE